MLEFHLKIQFLPSLRRMVLKKVVVLMMGCLGLSRQPIQPAETDESLTVFDELVCDDSRKIKLSDGRLLAYYERGVPRDESSCRVIMVHGFASSKKMNFMASQVHELLFRFICASVFDPVYMLDPNRKLDLVL